MIDRAVRMYVGKPNLSEIVRTLQSRDPRFNHLSHQRLSDWRDKTKKEFVWSKETLHEVAKEFLPGGNQTRYNIFVSFFIHGAQYHN
jgi:hypothetical protein